VCVCVHVCVRAHVCDGLECKSTLSEMSAIYERVCKPRDIEHIEHDRGRLN
jgi:hypothetical protein